MKIFLDEQKKETKEKKVMYSTSLPESLNQSLDAAAHFLHRKKADWVRSALSLFLSLSEKEQEEHILKFYNQVEKSRPRPFTTTLYEGQLSQVDLSAKRLKRSKAEIIRSAVFLFLTLTPQEQEQWVKKTLSR